MCIRDSDNTLQYALKSDVGVYTNTKLYAATSLTASKSEWKEIATINQATGEITYVKNSTSEFLLNYYGHSNAQLVAHIGVVPYTPCAIAMATQNSVYPAKSVSYTHLDVYKRQGIAHVGAFQFTDNLYQMVLVDNVRSDNQLHLRMLVEV